MTQADSVHSTPPTNTPIDTRHDDELGMAWWNGLTEQERRKWSAIAGNTGRPKDAWEAFRRGSMDQPPPVDPTRRRFLAVAAVASVVSAGTLAAAAAMDPNFPAAVTTPAVPGMHPDAELIELGARFEPLVDRYYVAHRRWSAALARAHAEHDAEFGDPADRDFEHPPEIRNAFADKHPADNPRS